ncbi:NUDIX domain-containing protein [Thermosipho ferrireducens]|uniref:inorganic diphosphatase n=1 Tax=Thermosipho ferrireducens TaxID=2571116 RepID=A0ABX7S5S9_9BACT|nr:NUDIX domain-containing protein [Thermosipho ferrireducens]QTA37912.1 NUDIX domain-containing protein [Thermosipho ferrireducens]
MKQFLGKTVTVKVDRPIGSKHPEYGFYYPVNYGYVPNTLSGDGEETDAYILGIYEPIVEFTGKVIGIIHRKNDNEDKLVVANKNALYSREEIRVLTDFQERFFDIEIIALEYLKQSIRNTVRGIIRRGDEILVVEEKDEIKGKYYYLPGGGIEFLEKSDDAIYREIREELECEIHNIKYKVTIENLFEINGIKCHEMCRIYELKVSEEMYQKEEINITADIFPNIAKWVNIKEFKEKKKVLYPEKLIDML